MKKTLVVTILLSLAIGFNQLKGFKATLGQVVVDCSRLTSIECDRELAKWGLHEVHWVSDFPIESRYKPVVVPDGKKYVVAKIMQLEPRKMVNVGDGKLVKLGTEYYVPAIGSYKYNPEGLKLYS